MRTTRFWWVLMAILLPAMATPAAAAVDLCARFPHELSEPDIAALRQRIAMMVPVRYAKLAKMVPIVSVPLDDDHVAPSAVRADGHAGGRIEIPAGFRAFQCRLVMLQAYYWWKNETLRANARADMNRCVTRLGNLMACLQVMPAIFLSDLAKATGLNEADFAKVSGLIDEAFDSIILHEFAHVALGHLQNPGDGDEIEADTFATIHQLLYSGKANGLLLTYSALEFADDQFPSDAHGSFLCRAQSADAATVALIYRIQTVLSWPGESAQRYPKNYALMKTPRESSLQAERAERARKAKCGQSDAPFLARVAGEVEALAALLAAMPAATATDPEGFYSAIDALDLKTDEARYVRARVVSLQFRFLHLGLRSVSIASGDLSLGSEAYFRGVDRAITDPDRDYMASADYGRLLSVRASARWTRPDFLDGKGTLDDIEKELLEAVYYNPEFGLNFVQLTLIQVGRADCDAALRSLDSAIALSADPIAVQVRDALIDILKTEKCSRDTTFSLSARMEKMPWWPRNFNSLGQTITPR